MLVGGEGRSDGIAVGVELSGQRGQADAEPTHGPPLSVGRWLVGGRRSGQAQRGKGLSQHDRSPTAEQALKALGQAGIKRRRGLLVLK